ncbi:MAG: glucose-6-phosphate isomerase [Deltaproteobacteria bacterium]|nr:MAG: glucose-6-phosphate isomerase [Deltaproteobacteria bacterium]
MINLSINPGEVKEGYRSALEEANRVGLVERLWKCDYTLWSDAPDEIVDRLGWLNVHEEMLGEIPGILALKKTLLADGYERVLLLGMGGSSLAPELFAKIFKDCNGLLLEVLDTTVPADIIEVTKRIDPEKTLFIVSSKSGTTVEPISLMKHFFKLTVERVGEIDAPSHFVVITTAGTALAKHAEDFGFRAAYLNDTEIGGRYSALSLVGLVPAALTGVDDLKLLKSAAAEAERARGPLAVNLAASLGVFLGECARMGRDKLTLLSESALGPFSDWAEQLIAESTGKAGKGLLPVIQEGLGDPEDYCDDRIFLSLSHCGEASFGEQLERLSMAGHPVIKIELDDRYDLGGLFFIFEFATAAAGWRMGIHPFNQPDVEAAKESAREALVEYEKRGSFSMPKPDLADGPTALYGDSVGGSAREAVLNFFASSEEGGYVSIQSYLGRDPSVFKALNALKMEAVKVSGRAVTLGLGPRFLHSTGQLHKGGATGGRYLQITGDDVEDLAIPGEEMTFGVLKDAQALGDAAALKSAGRSVLRVHIRGNILDGLNSLLGRQR